MRFLLWPVGGVSWEKGRGLRRAIEGREGLGEVEVDLDDRETCAAAVGGCEVEIGLVAGDVEALDRGALFEVLGRGGKG